MMVDGGGGDYNPSYFLSPESHERLLINWSFLKDKVGVKNRSELGGQPRTTQVCYPTWNCQVRVYS